MLYKISSSPSPWLDQSFLLSTVCPQKVDYIIFSASFGRLLLAFMVVFVHLGQFQATEGHLGYVKHFLGIPSSQQVSIWANCYCIWGMLFAVMSACCRRNRWTSTMDKWLTHLSSHVSIAHRRYNNIQSFGFSIIRLSKMKNKLRR